MSTFGAAPAPILTEAELRLLQALVYQECGMHFDERRTHFLQDRLLKRLKECRVDSFYAYYRLLISQNGKAELAKLVENLTVNETSFFRHKAQLDLFQKHVLEDMLKQKQARRELFHPHLERRLLDRPGSLHISHDGRGYPGLLLPAQSAPRGNCITQAFDSATLARGNPGQRHKLLRAAHGAGRRLQRASDGRRGLRLPPALLR